MKRSSGRLRQKSWKLQQEERQSRRVPLQKYSPDDEDVTPRSSSGRVSKRKAASAEPITYVREQKSKIIQTKTGSVKLKSKTIEEIDTTNITVDIITVKAAEIRKSERTKHYRPKNTQKLLYVPSAIHRSKLYYAASQAIAYLESKALVSHGGRPWQCVVTISDGQGASSANVDAEGNKNKDWDGKNRLTKKGKAGGGLPLFRWYKGSLELACLPHLLEKIDVIDENHGLLKSAQAHGGAEDMEEEEKESEDQIRIRDLAERQPSVLSTLAWNDANYPIPNVERKWISPDLITFRSRSAAIEHSSMLLERDKVIDRVLYGIGKRGDVLRPVKPTRKLSLEAGYYRFLRDGLWVVGQEEEWIQDRMDCYKEEEEEEEEEEEDSTLLKAPQDKIVDIDFYEEKKEENESIVQFDSPRNVKAEEKNEQLDHMNNKTTLQNDVPKSNGIHCEKEGIGGSKEGSLTMTEQLSTSFKKEHDSQKPGSLCMDVEVVGDKPLILTSGDEVGKSNEPQPQDKDIKHEEQRQPNSQDQNTTIKYQSPEYFKVNNDKRSPDNVCLDVEAVETICSTVEASKTANENTNSRDVKNSDSYNLKQKDKKSDPFLLKNCITNETLCDDVEVAGKNSKGKNTSQPKAVSSKSKKKRVQKRKRQYQLAPSTHWRLTQKQIDLCHNAVKEHYDKVMYTVKAKALFSELADGFDVFRERGRGRYDMQPPAFESPDFDFLTDLEKAPWMPVVRKILGEEVVLVHKGAFLSIPGSATQVYHQDGPHLTQKYQRECHAINVFIPLVQLNEKNGPTEFCIGTHYLGYDSFCRDMVDVPLNKAGSPIIFDYRLGHRGLGNSSSESRPLVYLTYTSASNEFRDSVNFSKKRYRKLGELVEKPMTREERVLKRMREK